MNECNLTAPKPVLRTLQIALLHRGEVILRGTLSQLEVPGQASFSGFSRGRSDTRDIISPVHWVLKIEGDARGGKLLPFLLQEVERAARWNRVFVLRLGTRLECLQTQELQSWGYVPYGRGEAGVLWWNKSLEDVESPVGEQPYGSHWTQPMGQGSELRWAEISGGAHP